MLSQNFQLISLFSPFSLSLKPPEIYEEASNYDLIIENESLSNVELTGSA